MLDISNKVVTGESKKVTAKGPTKVLGTTPGNSKWSYWKKKNYQNKFDIL